VEREQEVVSLANGLLLVPMAETLSNLLSVDVDRAHEGAAREVLV